MKELERKYVEWLEVCDDLEQDTDCGIPANREDFSNFADLEEEISFEEMLELERSYRQGDKKMEITYDRRNIDVKMEESIKNNIYKPLLQIEVEFNKSNPLSVNEIIDLLRKEDDSYLLLDDYEMMELVNSQYLSVCADGIIVWGDC
jgi:hypothetical protein